MPDLAAIQNEYAALGVQVVGASADVLTDRQKVVIFIKETGINFPVWVGATTEEMKRFGLGPALPGTVVIGRDGKLLAVKNGVITRDYLKKQMIPSLRQIQKQSSKRSHHRGHQRSPLRLFPVDRFDPARAAP